MQMWIALGMQSFKTVETRDGLMENFCCGLIVYLDSVEIRELKQYPWSNYI